MGVWHTLVSPALERLGQGYGQVQASENLVRTWWEGRRHHEQHPPCHWLFAVGWCHLIYLQVGMEVAPHLKESLTRNFFDFLLTFKQVGERHRSSLS